MNEISIELLASVAGGSARDPKTWKALDGSANASSAKKEDDCFWDAGIAANKQGLHLEDGPPHQSGVMNNAGDVVGAVSWVGQPGESGLCNAYLFTGKGPARRRRR